MTRYCLKKKSSYFAPETTTPWYIVARKGKNRPEICKVLPNTTNISQNTGNHFYFMQCVSVFMPGVPLERIFTGFQKNTV